MIPSNIVSDALFLQASIQAALPLETATPLLKGALVTAGNNLVAEIQTGLASAAGGLDAGDPTGYAGDLVTALLALAIWSNDQATLADMRGTVGRAVFNIGQA